MDGSASAWSQVSNLSIQQQKNGIGTATRHTALNSCYLRTRWMQTAAEVFMNLLQVDRKQSHELCDQLRLFGDEALWPTAWGL